MESKIINQTKNPFLEREEFTLEITNETTPTFDEVKSELGKDASLTVVKKINTNFGRKTFLTEAVIYDNAEANKKIETIPKKVKKKIEAEEKAAAEATKKAEAEAKAAEAEAKAAEEAAKEAPAEDQEPTTKNQEQNQDN